MEIYPYDGGEVGPKLVAFITGGYRIHIYPRNRYNLFKYKTKNGGKDIEKPEKVVQYTPIAAYLEAFQGESKKIKDIEKRMYLDLCQPFPVNATTNYCLRKITVLIETNQGDHSQWEPFFPGPFTPSDLVISQTDDSDSKAFKQSCKVEVADPKNLFIKLVSGSNKTRFVSNNQLVTEINVRADTMIDRNGIVEIIIAHPVENVAQNDATIKIKVAINNGQNNEKASEEFELHLTRNEAVTSLDDVGKIGVDAKADKILVFQTVNQQDCNALPDLKKKCNQVVPRSRLVENYPWLDEQNKKYDVDFKTSINKFIIGFKDIRSGTKPEKDYPYSLECFGKTGIDADLAKHITDEYGINYKDNLGIVIDRNLLIGAKASASLKDTDGLLDLYENVVKKYLSKVFAISEDYRRQNTPWFHYPDFGGPTVGEPIFKLRSITLKENKIQYLTQQGADTKTKNVNGQEVADLIPINTVFNEASIYLYRPAADWTFSDGRIRVTHNNSKVWIALTEAEWTSRDDQGMAKNMGNYGEVFEGYDYSNHGVCYCWGGKNSLVKFHDRLKTIDNITKNWNKYPDTDLVDVDDQPAQKIIGLDCTGLVQNCLTHIYFDEQVDGQSFRIIPDPVIPVYTYDQKNSPSADQELMCTANLTMTGGRRYAAVIPTNQRKFLTRGDVIVDQGNPHIAMVTVDENTYPCSGNNDNKDFAITHNYGGTHGIRTKNKDKPWYSDSYIHKTIRSPFHAWKDTWVGMASGRTILWV